MEVDESAMTMRKMMNTNALPTNDPMKVFGDITISSPMKDVVQDIFTAAEKTEEKLADLKIENEKKIERAPVCGFPFQHWHHSPRNIFNFYSENKTKRGEEIHLNNPVSLAQSSSLRW